MKMLLLLVFLLTGITFGYANSGPFIIDKANVLSDLEEEKLNKILADYERQSSVELVGMTIDSLKSEDILDYSKRVFNDLKIGKRDVNNGGLILIAVKDKKLRISIGYGLEWPVDDVKAGFIIEEMVPFFKKDNYFEALNLGFTRLIGMTSKYSWTIENKNIDSLVKTDIGKIFSFETKFVEEIYEKPKNDTDGSFVIKLSPFKQIIVDSTNQRNVIVSATTHMDGLIEIIKRNESNRITARLNELNPITFELLGVSIK